MSILSVLYALIISPLELLFEFIFVIVNRIIGNEGVSIIFLSLAVNFLVLPLYKRADELQNEERDIQAKMASWIKHIKKTFKGDERFFMLQEYYRINHYKPVYALKSSVSLILQIPFFIAAYNLLSGMQSLKGMPFGFISDLGKEDAMFTIGNFPINILPILMTLINIVSGIIYTKGHTVREKVQVYGLAAVFLILLYRSPSGLVFYWLLNNVFSLVKNIFYKLRNPQKVLHILLALSGLAIIISSLIRSDLNTRQKVLLCIAGFLLILPLVKECIKTGHEPKPQNTDTAVFFAGALLMAIFTGIVIPSAVINDSPLEFIDIFQIKNPAIYLISSGLMSIGAWVLWGGVFYFFMTPEKRHSISRALWVICGISLADYMLFGNKLGNLSSTLQLDLDPSFTRKDYLLNFLTILVICVVFVLVFERTRKLVKPVLFITILVVTSIGFLNTLGISGMYSGYLSSTKYTPNKPSIPLSKNGKNVVVLVLDRAMGTQVPYILNEKPELQKQFDGFTYYPNTISFGPSTIIASPALYGGYEYTPTMMNERASETMLNKHNEALKVMPVLFRDNGYSVTVCDPSFAGYSLTPDLSIYSDYPDIYCCTAYGSLNFLNTDNKDDLAISYMLRINQIRNRNFFCFAIMKVSPLILQNTVYNGGLYNESGSSTNNANGSGSVFPVIQTYQGITKSYGISMDFLNSYAVLNNLSTFTKISDSNENTFLLMENDTTHEPVMLQEPDYTPSVRVDNTAYDTDMVKRYTLNGKTMPMSSIAQVRHYHVNMAAFLKLGDWFDYLRENGVYDNTRIIIVSDHGRNLEQFGVSCEGIDMEFFMPLLMVKDFNAKGFSVNKDFMTNADTPTLAAKNIITDPRNPFTGKPINSQQKNGPQTSIYSKAWSPDDLEKYTIPPSKSFEINSADPHDSANWKYIGVH